MRFRIRVVRAQVAERVVNATDEDSVPVYIGTYTSGKSQGIYHARFDSRKGTLTPPELAAKMQYDVDRWKRGETNCSKKMPKVTAAAPAQR